VKDRVLGLLLFLPVPIVLWLYTRQPIGVIPSLLAGTLLMLTHPLYARPFALRRAPRRCLWCGGAIPESGSLELRLLEPRGLTSWRACSEPHGQKLERVLGWAQRNARFLRAGILGVLGIFLIGAVVAALGRGGPVTPADAAAFFRLGVALTVLPLGWLSGRPQPPPDPPIRTPFPVHLQALIGSAGVIWLFRLIGLLWLTQGILHFARR
jgi:hypothetical protein